MSHAANRRSMTTARLAAIVVVATAALGACDTGDGKELKDFDPADYPSQTTEPIVDEFDGLVPGDTFDPLATFDTIDGFSTVEDGFGEPFTVIAPWPEGGTIDVRYTCDGENQSPALSWGGVPAGTQEIAISMVDDSALSDGQPFVHWVIGGLDPAEIALIEDDVPLGALQAINFFGDIGYGGPCPPQGDDPHSYRLTAYALGQQLEIADGTPATEFLDLVNVLAIAQFDVTGFFGR